jgi:serine protease Do
MKHAMDSGRLAWAHLAALAALSWLLAAAPLWADEAPSAVHEQDTAAQSELDDPFGMDRLFVPRWRLTDGPQMRAAFREVIQDAARATVCVHCDGNHKALGAIVRPDGWVVTKATPLCGKLSVILADGRQFPAVSMGESGPHDLALLKIDAADLPALDLTAAAEPEVGSWLASVGRARDPVAVGVVSVGERAIPAQPGILGVQLEDVDPLVVMVFPESAADEAGIEPHDRIVSVSGAKTPSREKLKEVVAAFNPGDEVTVVVEREGRQIELQAKLGGQFPGMMGRSEFQNSLGGKLSVRRFGFPRAIQHDTVLQPSDCGGPVVDLDGRLVGFNIARAGRTESYALPAAAVDDVVRTLMKKSLLVQAKAAPAAAAETSAAPTTKRPAPARAQ